MATKPGHPRLIGLYFNQPDDTAHFNGVTGPKTKEAVHYVDGIAGKLMAALSSLPPGRDATYAEDRKSFNVSIALGPPHILPQQPTPAQYRASYGYQIDVAGGTAPYTFAQTGGTLPAGLTVSPTGFLGSFPSPIVAQPTPYLFDEEALGRAVEQIRRVA